MTKPKSRKPTKAEVDKRLKALETSFRGPRERNESEEFAAIERFIQSASAASRDADGNPGYFRRLPERAVIENALRLANMRDWGDFAAVWNTLGSRGATATYSSDAEALDDVIRTFKDEQAGEAWRDLFAEDFQEYRREQKDLVSMLELINKGLPAARKKLSETIEERLQGLVFITLPKFRDGRLTLEPHVYAPGIRSAVAYAVALLLDPDKKAGRRTYGECLRRCAYGEDEAVDEPCGQWFLAISKKVGGQPPKYCETHRLIAVVSSTERARKSRARSKASKRAAK